MKFKEIFKMVVRCFCKEKSERCEGCRLEQAAKSLPNGIEESAIALVEDVLEPTSEVYGKPIGVLNGFCCPVRLRLMGESLQSAHVRGEAADICALVTDGEDLGLENLELARAVMEVGFYDVLVLGDVEPGSIKPKWIKVCWKRNGNNMGMVLKKEAGKAEVEQLSKMEMKELTKG